MQSAWTIRSCGVASLGSRARIAPALPALSSRRRSANCRPAAASINRVSAAAGRLALGVVKPQSTDAMHRPVAGLRQGRRRECNIMVEIQKVLEAAA